MLRLAAFVALALVSAGSIRAQEHVSERVRVLEFLRDHAQDKLLVGLGDAQEGSFKVNFRMSVRFAAVQGTESGLTFDLISDVRKEYQEVDDEGSAVGEVTVVDRRITRRVELTERKSTGHLVGVAITQKDSHADPTGDASAAQVEKSNDPFSLVLDLTGILYKDYSSDGASHQPVSTDETLSLRLTESGRLELDHSFQHFSVEPHTLARTLVGTLTVVSNDNDKDN